MNLATMYVPLAGIKKLWTISFSPEKMGSDLDAFNAIADIAARGCLLMGGISGMGNTFVICYGIFSNLLPIWAAGFITFIMMCFLFLMFDLFLGVAYPLFINFMVAGKFKWTRGKAGTAWMFVAGLSLLGICAALATVTMSFSYYSSEIAVSTSVAVIQNESDSTGNHSAIVEKNQEHLQTIIHSYDRSLKNALRIDKEEIERKENLGRISVQATITKYSARKYSRGRFIAKVKQARRDSANNVDSYERHYLKVSRDKEDAVSKAQSSHTRIEHSAMAKRERMNEMYDKYSEIGAWFLAMVGCLGTLLFMGIKFVQGVLNKGLEKVSEGEAEEKRSRIYTPTGTDGGSGGTETRTNGTKDRTTRTTGSSTRTGKKEGSSKDSRTTTRTDKDGKAGTGGTKQEQETIFVPGIVNAKKSKADIKRSISRHAWKWNNIKFNEGQGNLQNEYDRWWSHLIALKSVDPSAYQASLEQTKMKHGITLK